MELPYGLSIEEAIIVIQPLLLFVIGMAVYSVFIYHFYRFLAKKDVITLDLRRHTESRHALIKFIFKILIYIFENILFVPLFTFFWFGVLTILIAFLAKEQAVQNIILASMALVGAVRITAYYKEDLSSDLAKTLPLALLAIYLTEASSFSYQTFLGTLQAILDQWKLLIYYLTFAVILEILLNLGYELFSNTHPKEK
jgi:hypothetical protein